MTHPIIRQLKRHLDESIWTDVAPLNETFSELVVDQEMKVNVAQKVTGDRKTRLDNTLTLVIQKTTKVIRIQRNLLHTA